MTHSRPLCCFILVLLLASSAPLALAQSVPAPGRGLPGMAGGGPKIPLHATEREALAMLTQWQQTYARPGQGRNGGAIFTYGATLPTIVCKPLTVCDVRLAPGETVLNVSVGDAVRWEILPAVEGEGEQRTTHLIVKPRDVNIETTAVVTTDQRAYHLRLVSAKKKWMHAVEFWYPEDALTAWKEYRNAAQKKAANDVARLPALEATDLNFNYAITGVGQFKPQRVFDDGQQTYIELPPKSQVTPVLMLVENKEQKIVNYRVKNRWYVVDRLFDHAQLIYGDPKEKGVVITIQRLAAKKRARVQTATSGFINR